MADSLHSHDSDGLLQFLSESAPNAPTSAEARTADATARSPHEPQHLASTSDIASASGPDTAVCDDDDDDQDWLALFAIESVHEPAPVSLASAPEAPPHRLDQPAPREPVALVLDHSAARRPAALAWSRSAFVRLAAASVAAFVAGAVTVLFGLHALRPPSEADVDQMVASPSSPTPSLSAVNQTRVSTPRVEPGISASALRHLDQVAIVPPRVIIPGATAGTSGTSALKAPTTPRQARDGSPEIAPPAQRADRAPAEGVSTVTRLATVPGGSGEELLPETTRVPAGADPALAPRPKGRSAAAAEENAVRRTLLSYEEAYQGLNVAATAAVWPSVDRRALSRAFDTLKSQGLDFQSCAISVADSRATANCRGTLQFVRKVGNSEPLIADQQWVFKMRRLGADWKIDEVSASQTPVLTSQRIRGEE